MTTDRQARLEGARHWGGYRQAHFTKSTDTMVVVVEAVPANLDPGDHGETKWYTVCDDHNRLVGHSTLALARYHSSAPEEWCEVCSGHEEPDIDEPDEPGRWVGSV
jgi:hypothetical protein